MSKALKQLFGRDQQLLQLYINIQGDLAQMRLEREHTLARGGVVTTPQGTHVADEEEEEEEVMSSNCWKVLCGKKEADSTSEEDAQDRVELQAPHMDSAQENGSLRRRNANGRVREEPGGNLGSEVSGEEEQKKKKKMGCLSRCCAGCVVSFCCCCLQEKSPAQRKGTFIFHSHVRSC